MKPTHSTTKVAPGAWPVLGHALPLLRHSLSFIKSLPELGDVVQIRLGRTPVLMLCDPQTTRQALLDDRTFDKGGIFFDRLRDMAGNGLGTCPYSDHRRQRRLLQPAFHHSRMGGYAQEMTREIDKLTSSWQDGEIIDVLSEMKKLMTRITATALFGCPLPPKVISEVNRDITDFFDNMYWRLFAPPLLSRLPTPGNRSFRRTQTRLRGTLTKIVTDHQDGHPDHGDLLSALVNAAKVDDSSPDAGLSNEEINDQIVSFFAAAMETTTTGLASAFHLLAQHPDIAAQLHEEADNVLAGRLPTLDDVPKLGLASRVMAETLRMYPPVWFATRIVTQDTQLGDHVIPARTTIAYSPFLIHNSPEFYPEPERFSPSRWDSDHTAPPPRNAYLPFGTGARKCIGEAFAITEATLVLAAVASRWNLQALPDYNARPALSATLGFKGVRLRASARGPVRDRFRSE